MTDSNQTIVKQENLEPQVIIQVVVFSLGSEEYGIPIYDVKEVIKTPEITPLPNSAESILGIINLRGNIIPILDLQKVFSVNFDKEYNLLPKRHVIVTQTESPFGILVHKVNQVISVFENEIKDSPNLTSGGISNDYIQGVIIVNDEEKLEKNQLDNAKDDESSDSQKAILVLRVSQIISAKDLVIAEDDTKSPIAQHNIPDVQQLKET